MTQIYLPQLGNNMIICLKHFLSCSETVFSTGYKNRFIKDSDPSL